MKKQLLAIAVSATSVAPMASMAQPELYGRFDVTLQQSESMNMQGDQAGGNSGINNLNGEISAPLGAPRYNSGAADVGQQWETRNNKSRLGVRGSSDLDVGGLSAIYQLEMQFEPVDGGGPNFQNRNTFVGLQGDSWGKFFVGRYDSLIKQAEFDVDQFNNTDADIENVLATQQRYNNTLNYESAKIGPGIQVKAQIMPGESRQSFDDNEADRETAIADAYALSVGMEEGNMYGAIAYETAFMQDQGTFGTPPQTNTTDIDTLRVSGGLDDDMFGVGFLWEQVDGSDLEGAYGQGNDDSRSGWILSGRYNVTEPLAVKVQHGTSDEYVLMGNNNSSADDRELVQTTIGADYSLGKQTKVYAFYSMQEADGKVDLQPANPATDATEDDSEFTAMAFGMQHKF